MNTLLDDIEDEGEEYIELEDVLFKLVGDSGRFYYESETEEEGVDNG